MVSGKNSSIFISSLLLAKHTITYFNQRQATAVFILNRIPNRILGRINLLRGFHYKITKRDFENKDLTILTEFIYVSGQSKSYGDK